MQVIPKGPCAVALLVALTLMPLPSTAQSITETVSVVVVDVPVQVTRKGEPVRGLTIDDFQLFAGGKKVKIASFDVHDVSLSIDEAVRAPGQPARPALPPRHLLLLFDLSFSDVGSLQRSQIAAREIVSDSVDPKDLVAVTTYSATTGLRHLLNFTSDRAQILAAIDSMGVNQRAGVDPLNMILVEPDEVARASRINDGAQDDPGTGANRQEIAIRHLLAIQAMVGQQDKRNRSQQVGNLAHDFTGLARLLNSVRARKQVIYLSEGFENDLMVATEDQVAQRAMSNSAERGQIWNVDSSARFGDSTRQHQIGSMIDELRRSDCVVHAIDIRTVGDANLEGGGAGRGKLSMGGNQGLSAMASGTGGSYQRNTNQIGQALRNVLLETQVTYMLSFDAGKLKQNGAFHKIKVKLTGAAKGAKVTHRPGFYAPDPEGSKHPEQIRLALGQKLMAANEGGAIPTEVLAMPFAMDDDRALVPVLLEIDGKSLIGPTGAKQIGVQIFAYAIERESGGIHDFFSKTIGVNVEAAGAAFSDTGLKFYGSIELPAGKYDLRLLVVEPTSGRTNLRIVPLDVPDFSAGAAELMPPLVPDAGGKWLLARIEPAEGQARAPYPFMADRNPFLPGAHPSVKTGETLRLLLVGRNLGDGRLEAAAELTDAEGQTVLTPELSPLQMTRTGMKGYAGAKTALSTDQLAPGEYTLALTVTAGGEPQTSTIPLTVR